MRGPEVVLLLVFLLGFLEMIMYHYSEGIKYHRAKKYHGLILERFDVEAVRFSRYDIEVYETYLVEYIYRGIRRRGYYSTTEKNLRPGRVIEVYVYDREGDPQLQSDIHWRKFKLYFIVFVSTIVILSMTYLAIALIDRFC